MVRFEVEGCEPEAVIKFKLKSDTGSIVLVAADNRNNWWYILRLTPSSGIMLASNVPANIGLPIDREGYVNVQKGDGDAL